MAMVGIAHYLSGLAYTVIRGIILIPFFFLRNFTSLKSVCHGSTNESSCYWLSGRRTKGLKAEDGTLRGEVSKESLVCSILRGRIGISSFSTGSSDS